MRQRRLRRVCIGAALLGGALLQAGFAGAIEVQISGLSPEFERNVRAYLSIDDFEPADEESDGGFDAQTEERRIRQLHAAADAEIASGLRPYGYYEPAVAAELERGESGWVARYTVDPGRPVLLTVVDVEVVGEGRESEPVAAALARIDLEPGQVLDHEAYQRVRDSLYDAAYYAGYIDASYPRSEVLVRRSEYAAEIHLRLDTGPRYYFGVMEIEQSELDPEFIERFIDIDYDDPFDADRLVALQITLEGTGYFDNVDIDIERERAEDRRIPVFVTTTPRRPQEYTIGGGYGTDTGPRARFGLELRRIGTRGHRFDADLRLSAIEQIAAADYRIPRRNVATDYHAFRTSLGDAEIGDWDTRRLMLGTAWQDGWRGLRRHLYGTVQREKFATELTAPQTENFFFAGMQLIEQESDDALYPTRGYSWSSDLRAGSDVAFAATSFARLHVTGNLVRSFGNRMRVLVRTELGALWAGDFDRLVPSQRFYAGGDSSVRGYGYQKIGPRDENGANVGGRYLFRVSAELEFRIVDKYGAAVFFDAGDASNRFRPDFKRGIGVGMRWLSPVGVVGIDIAHPLDDPDRSYRLHLRIGTDL